MRTAKENLKRRKSVMCGCKRKRPNNDRMKYGTCRCDAYSMHYTLGLVLSNYLYQYLADASQHIQRDDWDVIEYHADAIRDYYNADSWDDLSKDRKVRAEWRKKRRKFEQAMRWMVKNWEGLWW